MAPLRMRRFLTIIILSLSLCVHIGVLPVVLAFLSPQHRGPNLLCKRTPQQATTLPAFFFGQARAVPVSCIRNCRQKSSRERASLDVFSRIVCLRSKSEDEFVEAEDLEALQALFTKYCDKEGLMTKEKVTEIPPIDELLAQRDLLPQELDDIWDRAPKFPDTSEKNGKERIDVDSFVQVYRDIDDLFESEQDDEDQTSTTKQSTDDSSDTDLSSISLSVGTDNALVNDDDEKDDSFEAELESIFEQICDEKTGLLTKSALKQWDEVQKLLADGLLGEDELDDLWSKTKKSNGGSTEEMLDVDGFLSFNVALDDLFDFDSEEMEKESNVDEEDDVTADRTSTTGAASGPELRMVEGEKLEPDVLFVSLADENGLVGLDDLRRWQELQDLIDDGELGVSELEELFRNVKKSEMDLNKVEKAGFVALCKALDDLFEDDNDDDDKEVRSNTQDSPRFDRKAELLDAINDLALENLLPCGLEATEREQREILSIAEQLEQQPTNMIRFRQVPIEPKDLDGTWELLYSSSSAMKFNKGLSGLGGSFPNGRFGSLKQKLTVTKFLTDVEYVERIEVTPKNASFDVTVTGTWDLRNSVSLFTGEPSVVMSVRPDRVSYGPTSTRADHWKSLGPLNMLDISYLDEDLRIMRGNTAVETLFIFRRI